MSTQASQGGRSLSINMRPRPLIHPLHSGIAEWYIKVSEQVYLRPTFRTIKEIASACASFDELAEPEADETRRVHMRMWGGGLGCREQEQARKQTANQCRGRLVHHPLASNLFEVWAHDAAAV